MRKSRIGLTLKEVDQNRQTLVRPKPEAEPSPREDTSVLIYTALFTKLAPNKKRKNKSFSDGTLRVTAGVSCVLMDEAGKDIGRKKLKQTEVVAEDSELVVGAWEVEVSQLRPETPAGTTLPSPVQTGPAVKPAAPRAAVSAESVPDLVLDNFLDKVLRPHQREGVHFLYDCVNSRRDPKYQGAILADDMGLGKTMQALALAWSLLRPGLKGKPIARKAIIAAPATLVGNWRQEIRRWMGYERMPCMVLQSAVDAAEQVNDFKHGNHCKVLIASYETLRKHCTAMAGMIDLLVCDEGHRLKASGGSKTMDSLLSLRCPRRVLLTGTPVQNNLDELYAMVSFVCPGLLGSSRGFSTDFAVPLSQRHGERCSAQDRQAAEAAEARLQAVLSKCLLRRTAVQHQAHLPPLHSLVVFCKPTGIQVQLYQQVLAEAALPTADQAADEDAVASGCSLPLIAKLRTVCSCPWQAEEAVERPDISDVMADGSRLHQQLSRLSGKFACLDALLTCMVGQLQERVVVCAGSTQLLDEAASLCASHAWTTVRVDGSVTAHKRADIVHAFNTANIGQVLLLSSKAGGAGLNLTGASRLILADSSWNPAVDAQALARIWRDGQRKPCTTYRLITTGTLEEQILQRHLCKAALASSVTGDAQEAVPSSFTKRELQALCHLTLDTSCATAAAYASTSTNWQDVCGTSEDLPLQAGCEAGAVTYACLAEARNVTPAVSAAHDASKGSSSAGVEDADEDDVNCLELD